MTSSAPDVLIGTRAPQSVRLEQARAKAAGATQATVVVPTGFNTYISRDRRYRVQITAPQSYIGPDGRKQSGGKMLVAEFDEGIYRNNHRDAKTRALIDEVLQSNPYFGPFGSSGAHYWLASDQQAVMEQARIKAALETLKALPKAAVDQFIGELKQGDAEDHEIPATGDGADVK